MWFLDARIDVEGRDIASDEVEGDYGFLGNVDSEIKCSL